MSYNSNIPKATDQISQSQSDILGNFQALNPLIIGVVDFPPSAGTPASTGNNTLYAQLYAGTGLVELFVRNPTNTTQIPFTAARKAAAGWTYLPSGLLMAWSTISGSGAVTLLYSSIPSFPGFSNTPYVIQLTPRRTVVSPNFQVYVDAFTAGANTNLQLGVFFTVSSGNAGFLVIGN